MIRVRVTFTNREKEVEIAEGTLLYLNWDSDGYVHCCIVLNDGRFVQEDENAIIRGSFKLIEQKETITNYSKDDIQRIFHNLTILTQETK